MRVGFHSSVRETGFSQKGPLPDNIKFKRLITALVCINASGATNVPPYIVYSEKIRDAAYRIMMQSHLNYWENRRIAQEVFLAWIKQFRKSLPKYKSRGKVVLLVDRHGSHKYLPTSRYCKKHCIVLYSLPAHTSHVLQPLDKWVISALAWPFGKTK